MDSYDKNILICLQEDARISNVDLAQRIHLSPPQTLRRVRALEEQGFIQRYCAQLSRGAVGLGVLAFVEVSIDREHKKKSKEIEETIKQLSEVIECHTVTGDFDYLLKVVSIDLKSISIFLTETLSQVHGIAEVKSRICLEEVKPLSALPITENISVV
jgi:Lrp/AsnC family leucine-responsive transcriptional regulator